MNVGRYLRGEDLHVGTSRITKPKELKMNQELFESLSKKAASQMPQDGLNPYNYDLYIKNLSRLIVKECAEVAGCNGHVSGFSLGDLIKQHFGVEE